MKKIIVVLLLAFNCHAAFALLDSLSIYFDVASFEITNHQKSLLDDLPDHSIISILGYTDADGDEMFNFDLSKKRVQSVFEYLSKSDKPNKDISLVYHGENSPICVSEEESCKKQNRRVDIFFCVVTTYSKHVYLPSILQHY